MPYSNVRFIGYQVATVAEITLSNNTRKVEYKIPPGTVESPPELKGDTDKLSDDAKIRVQRLIAVIKKSQDLIKLIDTEETLKVFIAPEFYFRPPNDEQSYTVTEYRAIKDVLRNTILEDISLKHWLIIPGTIMWKLTSADSAISGNRVVSDSSNETVYFNSSMFIKNINLKSGADAADSKVIEKAYASDIDGLPTGRHGGNFADDAKKMAAPEKYYAKYQSTAKILKHFFKINSISCGLEICLEHIKTLKLLKTNLGGYPAFDAKNGLDIQLLTAGGMPRQPESMVAKIGGHFFRSDGYSDKPTSTFKINTYSLDKKPTNVNSVATLDEELPKTPYDIDSSQKSLFLPAPMGYASTWEKQRINIYESFSLS